MLDHLAEAHSIRVDQVWRADAACTGRSDVMDPTAEQIRQARQDGTERLLWEPAKAICRGCPVLVQCRSWATTLPHWQDVSGVCGGLTPDERRGRQRSQRLADWEPPDTPADGWLECTKCGETKPDAEFASDPRYVLRRGRRCSCRACVSDYNRYRAPRRRRRRR